MRFPRPRRRALPESIVPMINVVFLLLIFFLMSARIAPPPPFQLTLPEAHSDDMLDETRVLFIAPDGTPGFGGLRGEAVWAALADANIEGRLSVRADGAVVATEIAALLGRLAAIGVTEVDLAVRPR